MRIGTFCKILRNADNLTLRKFAAFTHLPHSSIAALESGWLPPAGNTVTALLDYLSYNEPQKFHTLAQYVGICFLKEYAFRLYADNPFCPISWCSVGVLKAFLDSKYTSENSLWPVNFASYILPENLLPSINDSKRENDFIVYSYLWTLISNDILKYSMLTTETKFKILVWLVKDMSFLKPEETYPNRLTQPPQRIKKILDTLPPRLAHVARTFDHFLHLIAQDPPNRVPNSLSSLDIILLLCERVELNPLNPGEITAYLTSHTKKSKKVVCFYPPPVSIPEVFYEEPFLKIEETST
ncbi:helix-turn-helix transcriptional regulator [Desulfallas sp. Bu1-1]|uniref:helix-turn-helix domain-containing protein n=1 Tax=Desulfallas sp. Bu1-1 TaxID=2787620 RepID=UPI00189FC311|nr:helix-turn-helix transcriptional regulator [Desulfallas sp. Bu1-1]MBF7082657.1 helix-turn-helix transcriptional regulator [Desulfallas sp. Bu1-1]